MFTRSYFTSAIYGLLALNNWVDASPLAKRATINATDYASISLYKQFTSAAYCNQNYKLNTPSKTALTCGDSGNCPDIGNVQTVLKFVGTTYQVSGYVAVDITRSLIVVGFRGTAFCDNSQLDPNVAIGNCKANALSVTLSPVPEWCNGCEVATGDLLAWKEVNSTFPIIQTVQAQAQAHTGFRIVTTGHSFGAAMATIAAVELRRLIPNRVVDLGSYASPRLSNMALATFIQSEEPARGRNYRVTRMFDAIVNLPSTLPGGFPGVSGFYHISPSYYITNNVVPPQFPIPSQNDIQIVTGNEVNVPLPAGGAGMDVAVLAAWHVSYFGWISRCDVNATRSSGI
ncbi:alpha/beta-hydrolase [Microthyrium microscopicum]|uniref:Alpha/beta-hydrolase n=1 Tax=Microthyrium microscopicum TaxID=703497 RepID=A0A6A6UG77_9PEZI|nr:alpha/beta-hydrolase [Microthyrium microscopicum]